MQQIYAITETVHHFLFENEPMGLSPEEESAFQMVKFCHICEKPCMEGSVERRYHCLFFGAYGGAAHPGCNGNYRPYSTVPVMFHNLSNCDGHFWILNICEQTVAADDRKIKLNPDRFSITP